MNAKQQLEIWHRMTPEQRDYDRYVGQIPAGQSRVPETEGGRLAMEQRAERRRGESEGCSCHIRPPCSYCTDGPSDDNEYPMIVQGIRP